MLCPLEEACVLLMLCRFPVCFRDGSAPYEIAIASGRQVCRAHMKEGMVFADSMQCKNQETW